MFPEKSHWNSAFPRQRDGRSLSRLGDGPCQWCLANLPGLGFVWDVTPGTQHSHHPLFQNHYSGVTQQSGGKLSSLRIQTYFCWWVSPCLLVLPWFFPHLARYLIWTCLSYPFRIPSHRPWQLGIGRLSSSHCFSKSVLVGDGKEIQLEIHCQSHRENTYHRRPPGLQFGVAHAAGYLILLEIISPLYKFECARVSHPSWKTIGYYCMTSEL